MATSTVGAGRWLSISLALTLSALTTPAHAATFTLSWDAAETTDQITKYRVYRAENVTEAYTLLKSVTTLQTGVEVPTGQTRCYRVTAVDSLGQASPRSDYWCLTITTETGP